MGYSAWCLEESDTTERLSTLTLQMVFSPKCMLFPRAVSKPGQDLPISLILPQFLDHLFTASC